MNLGKERLHFAFRDQYLHHNAQMQVCVHTIAADGALLPDGRFVPLPAVPEGLLTEGFRRAVLEFLVRHAAISAELRSKLLGWRRKG